MFRYGLQRTLVAPIIAFLVLALSATLTEAEECLSRADRQALTLLNESYRKAWLANDADEVRRNFTQNAVLLPHHGLDPVVGMEAINQFWWPPDAPKTTVTRFDATYDEIGGCGSIAFVRGKSHVEWTVAENGKPTRFWNAGTFLTLMKKHPDGTWKITHQMWDDPPNRKQ